MAKEQLFRFKNREGVTIIISSKDEDTAFNNIIRVSPDNWSFIDIVKNEKKNEKKNPLLIKESWTEKKKRLGRENYKKLKESKSS